jgi:hypothetical protein
MSAAAKSVTSVDGAAFVASLLLHAALVFGVVAARPAAPPLDLVRALPNSVAMVGSSIEVEAPTPDLAEGAAAEASTPAPSEPEHGAVTDAAPRGEPGTEPRRKPARPRTASSNRSIEKPNDSGASASAPSAAGTFGQEGLPPGVRRLGYAFTRAIPAATPADSAWRELPPGHVGSIRIELEVDENNRVGALKRWRASPNEPEPPAVLERMVERTLLLLRAGQFALSGSNQPGSERLLIDVTLRDEAPDPEGADVVVQKKFEGATPGKRGTAYFRYGTGRAFEARVTIVRSGR